MKKKRNLKKQTLVVFSYLTAFLLLSLFLLPSSSFADDTSLCARVKIEIRQELTLERQAFDAHMAINNGLTNITLENVDIVVRFSDKDGNSVLASSDPNNTHALFFIRVDSMDGISNIEGAGTVAPSSTADIHWLIIPAPGASNGLEQGALYYVGATLKYTIGGKENVTEVSPDYIYVKPMPEMVLDYFLPNDVYGDDPFTPEIEPPIPFSLGVRVRNNGAGTAKSLKIDSAQPKIVDNDQGLLVGFTLTGSEVNGQAAANSLLANFGDIKPNTSGTGRWIMTCTLSGKFVDFKATFSHSDELGGQLTSLIDAVNTHFLIHDVLVDISARDAIRDFLAKDGDVYKVYESAGVDTEVLDQSASSSLSFKSQAGIESTYTLSTAVTAGFMYVRLTDPFSGQKIIKEVIRSDGKRIKTDNAWLSKSRNRSDPWQYFFNLFDAATTNSYTVVFTDAAGVNHAPVLQFIPDKTGSEGQQMSFLVQASDPDGTVPVLSASALPALARFTDQGNGTGVFDWTPAIGQSGRYEITFAASDGVLKTSQRVVIIITGTGNNPPFVPSSPSPQDGASNIAVNAILGWTGGDPDAGDTVTYDVYFGTSSPPTAKVSGNQPGRAYATSTLTYGTTYYWKIVARDSHGAETGGPVWRFTTLLASNNVTSTVAVNRSTYNPNETVAVTSSLRNPNQTTSLQNLVARISISNSQGTTLLTDEKQIQTILPGQTITTNTSWNTSKNPKGTYTVKLEVLDGATIVSTATTSFQILGSSQTGVGLAGTLTPQPNLVYQGKDETLSYSLTNNGNEDILNLSVKVLIINPETQEIKQTLEGTASVLMGATVNGSLVASTSDLTPGTYEADLEVSSTSLTQAKTLASATFKVIQAVTLPFSDNFDSYAVGASPPVPWFELGDKQGIATNTEFHSGQNSIAIGDGPDNSQSAFVGLGETYPDRIGYEVWVKVNSTASSAYVGFSEEILGIMPQFNAVYFNGTDGKVYFSSADKDHGFSVPLLDSFAIGVWHKIHVEIDFANLIGDVYIDDVLVGKDLPVSPKDATWEQDGTHSFQLNKIGVTHALGEPFYFDDFLVFSFSGEHTITVTTGAGGTVNPSGSVTVEHGGSQSFSITPDIGQHILDVKVDGVSVGALTAYTFTDVASDHTIEAVFTINQYAITASAGSNGTIAPSGQVTVDYNGSQTFNVTPNEGYHVADVKVDGISMGPVSVYTISNVTADHTIEVSFAINQYTLTATAGPNGTIAPSGPVTVDYNGSQTFNVTPNEGYHVADVKVDGASVGAVLVYTISNVTAGHTIEVSFAINQYTLIATAGVNGTITLSGPVTVDYNGSQTFTITPNEGYHVADVKVDGISVGAVSVYTISNVTAGHTIEATFAINQYTLIATAGVNGTISPSGAVAVDHGGSLTFTITPNVGWYIVDVKVDGISVGVTTSYTFSSITSAHTIEASFGINQYTLIATAGVNGTISPSGAITLNYGASQTFAMTPNPGYRISDVKVDGVSIGPVATYTFTNVTAAHTIKALFAINQYTITSTAGPNGTISPSGSITVDHGGSQTFTITPNTGYRVSDVEVDGVMLGVTKSYTFSNVTSDHTISATFKQIQIISLPFSDDFEDDPVGAQPNLPWDNFNGGPATVAGTGSHSPANSISVSSGPEGSGSAFVNLGDFYSDRIAYEVWTKVNSTASSAYIGFSEEILNTMPQFNAVYFNGTDGKVYFMSADKDHGFMVPILDSIAAGVWHKVHVEIDFANLIGDVYIDDVLVGKDLPVSPKDAVWEQDGTHSFQLNKIGVTHALGEPFYLDDFSIFSFSAEHTITATAGAGGLVSPSGAVTVNHGDSQTFTISPDAGYHILDVKVDGASIGAVTTYTFTDVASDHAIEATFSINQYSITATAGSNGTVTPLGPVTVDYNGSQTFTITPDAGYHILDVKVDGASAGAVATYVFSSVTSNHTIEASFTINQYTLTATAGSNGTITPSGPTTVDYNGSQTFTITPNEGYHVVDVKVDGVSVGPVTTYTFINVIADHTIEVIFGINQYTITATAGSNGTIAPSGAVAVNYNGNQTFTITPNEGYHVIDVKVDGASVGAVAVYTISNVTANHALEATFAINQYTLIATAGPNGSIVPSGAMTVNHGESLSFTITPNTGYRILDIKVDGVSIGPVATYTFTNVTAPHTINASFVINQHTITATAGSGGTITPSGSVTVNHEASLTFTITPNTGYRISDVEVDGKMLGVTKSYTFSNVTSDHTISATFKQIQIISLPFSDNFEDDPVGKQPNLPWDNFNGGEAIVAGTGSHSPANSISVSTGTEGNGSAFVNLGDTYPDKIAYEVWAKVNSTGSSAYVGFCEEILGIMPQFNAIYLNGSDRKMYFTSADKNHGFTVPVLNNLTLGVWHKIRVQIDFANLTADIFIDEVRVGSGLPVSPKDATWENEGTYSFRLNKIGVTHGLGGAVYYDDFTVSEWNPNTPANLLRSAGPGQWAVLGMGGIGSEHSTSLSMSGSSSVKGRIANTGIADAGSVNMSGSSLINGILSLNTAGYLNKSGTSKVVGGVQQNAATDGVLDQAVSDALAASQTAATLPATITSPKNVTISNPSQNITITGRTGTNVINITNLTISNGTLTLSAPNGGCFIMNVSGNFALSGASKIVLAGGITASDVLYNFIGSGGGVSITGGASVTGILLAPQRVIALDSSTVTGEILSGGSCIAFSGTTQVNNPGP